MKRPSARKVALWADTRAAIEHVRNVAFLLGYLPEKPAGPIDWEAVELQIGDARAVLAQLALALSDPEVEP